MPSTTVPRATVEALVSSYNDLIELHKQQGATQAEIIRWCVISLRADVLTYRIRGHEDLRTRHAIIAENKGNKAKALLYLEWLATQLENQSVR